MDTTEWDAKASEIEAAIIGVEKPMEKQVQEFFDAVASWLRGWWEDAARSAVVANALAIGAGEISDEALAVAHNGVRHLVSNSADVVRRHLDIDLLWAHRQPPLSVAEDEDSRYGGAYDVAGEQKLPKAIEDAIRFAMAEVGVILVANGLGTFAAEFPASTSADWRVLDAKLRFPFLVLVPDGVTDALDQYRGAYNGLAGLVEQLGQVRDDRARAVALDKWNAS